ncbi:Cholesterol 25-hydroxylase-like protein [Nymphaea thermarum]|nr:Cholesterol 25-hydroxylase-like protein [Nymphaea thermarum]
MVVKGWTRCYLNIEEIGWLMYVIYLIVHLAVLECGMYWLHRATDEVKLLYRLCHAEHHVYNSKHKLSPFAAVAIDPLDGIIQALPFLSVTLLVPTHFTTHLLVFFFESVWSINIHSGIDVAGVWPIMGPSYHLVHHLRPNYNYGNCTIFLDWLCGTLGSPEFNGVSKLLCVCGPSSLPSPIVLDLLPCPIAITAGASLTTIGASPIAVAVARPHAAQTIAKTPKTQTTSPSSN